MHLTTAGGKAPPAGKAPPKTPPKGAAAAKGGKPGAAGAAAVALDEEGALRMIQAVLTGRPPTAEQQLKDAVAKVGWVGGSVGVLHVCSPPGGP